MGKITARITGGWVGRGWRGRSLLAVTHNEADKCIHATCTRTRSKQGDKGKREGKGRIEKGGLQWLGVGFSSVAFPLTLVEVGIHFLEKVPCFLCNRLFHEKLWVIPGSYSTNFGGPRLLKIKLRTAPALLSSGDPSSASRPLFIEVGALGASPATQKAQIGPVAFFASERARVPPPPPSIKAHLIPSSPLFLLRSHQSDLFFRLNSAPQSISSISC